MKNQSTFFDKVHIFVPAQGSEPRFFNEVPEANFGVLKKLDSSTKGPEGDVNHVPPRSLGWAFGFLEKLEFSTKGPEGDFNLPPVWLGALLELE